MILKSTGLLFNKSVVHTAMALVIFAWSSAVIAKDSAFPEGSPHHAVQATSNKLVSALTENPAKLKADPKGYEKIVVDILVPIIDFELISKRVMGKAHYLAASPEQREAFQAAFKQSLVSTYSSGLAIFDSQKITVLPPKKGTEQNKKQSVNMEVKTADGTIFPLRFSVKQHDDGTWKVFNVLLNGVNVGKAYNSHFSESMVKHGNNIDTLIANWNANITSEISSNSAK